MKLHFERFDAPYRRRPLGRSVGYYKRYVALDVTNEVGRVENGLFGSSRSSLNERKINAHTILYEHSIATSRCRKTEWLLCGAHASSVLAARFPLVLYEAAESSRLPSIYSTDTSWRKSCFFPLALYAVAKYYYWSRA